MRRKKTALLFIAMALSALLLSVMVSAEFRNSTIDENSSSITSAKAQEIALKKVGGGTVIKSSADYDHGEKVYNITIIDGDTQYTMDVGASTGQIYEYKEEDVVADSGDSSMVVPGISGTRCTPPDKV